MGNVLKDRSLAAAAVIISVAGAAACETPEVRSERARSTPPPAQREVSLRVQEPVHLERRSAWIDNEAFAAEVDRTAAISGAVSERRQRALAAAEQVLAASISNGAQQVLPASISSAAHQGPSLRVHSVRTPARGSSVVRYRQEIDGIEVFGARANVLVDAAGRARVVVSELSPHAARSSNFMFSRAEALESALRAIDRASAEQGVIEAPSAGASAGFGRFWLPPSASFRPLRAARIKPVWYPVADRLVPAYTAEIIGQRPDEDRPIARAITVSAEDGQIFAARDLIHDAQPFSYRVFADPSGTPYFDPFGFTNPHPTGLPDGYLPTTPAPMNLVALEHSGIVTGDPWLPDGATETVGNNVDAFFNADTITEDFCDGLGFGPMPVAAEGDFHPQITAPGTFDYPYDLAQAPNDYFQCILGNIAVPPPDSPQINAKIVQGFYASNWLHDLFYNLGYDEVAGNSQTSNYGRGGIEGDPLFVHGGYLTTFAFTPEDGESPSLSLGHNGTSRSHRDVSGFDFGVLAHEWTHTMYARLAHTLFNFSQDGALNEGTADFVGFFLMVRAQDRRFVPHAPAFSGVYAVGAYMNRDYDYGSDPLPQAGTAGTLDNTYYHGIRRFPTSRDFAVNPLTFENVGIDHPLPPNLDAFDWKSRSLLNAEIHTAGEIWTAALWQCARNILAASRASDFEATRNRILGYLVAGLQLFPPNPTFTDARNSVLFAVRAESEADYRRCRAGFAERGMGAGALSPARSSASLRGAVDSFADVDPALNIVRTTLTEVSGGDGDGVLDRGELGRLTVTVKNTGLVTLPAIAVKVHPNPARYQLPGGALATGIALGPEEEAEVNFDIRLAAHSRATDIHVPIEARDLRKALHAHAGADFSVDYDLIRDTGSDELAAAQTFAADWTQSFDDFVHGCAQVTCLAFFPEDNPEVLSWERRPDYLGQPAYWIGADRMTWSASLETPPFLVSGSEPLVLTVRHEYDFDRETAVRDPFASPGIGAVEVSIGGGPWELAALYLPGGGGFFFGSSGGGWQEDTLDFGTVFAGQSVRLRFHGSTGSSWVLDETHWAIGRVDISGAAEAVFSTLHRAP